MDKWISADFSYRNGIIRLGITRGLDVNVFLISTGIQQFLPMIYTGYPQVMHLGVVARTLCT